MCYKSLESLKISCIDGLGPSPVVDQLCAVIGTIKELMALHLEGVRREHADFEPYCFMTHSHLHLVPRERERECSRCQSWLIQYPAGSISMGLHRNDN